jgi:hypothetical protein
MIINSTDFFFSGTLWYKNPETGICYRLVDMSALFDGKIHNEILTGKQIHPGVYYDQLAFCQERSMQEARRDS